MPLLAVVAVIGLAVAACTPRPAPQTSGPEPPSAWERRVGDGYENRGIARIEAVGRRWVLTVGCDGTHSTYIDPEGKDPGPYRDAFVRARYRYVERDVPVQCIRPPCGTARERRVLLASVERVEATEADFTRVKGSCGS